MQRYLLWLQAIVGYGVKKGFHFLVRSKTFPVFNAISLSETNTDFNVCLYIDKVGFSFRNLHVNMKCFAVSIIKFSTEVSHVCSPTCIALLKFS